jgi:UDP-N-acetylmuramoylalanine--D-glutamate ligase
MAANRIVILGGGESGVGAALLAQAKGFDVFLSDKGLLQDTYKATLTEAGIAFEEGQHSNDQILNAAEVVKSPGIPDSVPLVRQLRARGTPVISEIEFAARYTRAKLIGITGSNGKTTTALLTYHLLKSAGFNVGLAGNIGDSFARQVITDTFDYFVLEISSFQLDGMYGTRLDVAVLLNITPDHLDRYDYQFQNYVDSKFRILQNLRADDAFIYFEESSPIVTQLDRRKPDVTRLPVSLINAQRPGGYAEDGRLVASIGNVSMSVELAGLPLKGPHNTINMLVAMLSALTVGAKPATIEAGLRTFENAPHRLEPVATINGVQFINDSKATNVDSVFYALSSMSAPTIWIAGGQDKGNDYSPLNEPVRQRVKAMVCLGKDNQKLRAHFADYIPTQHETQNMTEAVRLALAAAAPGDVVLLSPACASFDLFRNYVDRGDQFKAAVMRLINEKA